MIKQTIGIDEAGRGPWAWPLVVAGIAIIHLDSLLKITWLTDSKKLSPQKRKALFEELKKLEKEGKVSIHTEIISAEVIDELGIREANRQAMWRCILSLLDANWENFIKIDGADNFIFHDFDGEYIFAKKKNMKNLPIANQWNNVKKMWKNKIQFFIGWDLSEIEISAASIVAKVVRDSFMEEVSRDFPHFSFHLHKWYGTKKHKEEILNYGINSLHRKSYKPIKSLIYQDK